ncbi:MAG: 3-deoxy-manno-octulosonate cytidylyltransferase [Holosporaceae bacterium]|jgi:3-deoxy-manno-octulosonate cytidylyltransferase (CMP-KDO synthetase)|nr:3-deoxy-manno-octulosonate cytidylyltransferase [Holosporaceae bacterium]
MNTLIVIPARIASVRLPEKMLADIGGKPLIVRTWESAVSAGVGDVIVACDGAKIANEIEKAGGKAVLTDPELLSGTDRVFAAWNLYDPERKYDFIINLQGDLPFIAPVFIREADKIIRNTSYEMATLATPIKDDSYMHNSVVKPVISFTSENSGKALYFSRSAVPSGGPFLHHVGIYCFRANGLEKFVNLPMSPLEKSEKLEQLRAIENNIEIGITVVDADPPISIDTADDLALARRVYGEK